MILEQRPEEAKEQVAQIPKGKSTLGGETSKYKYPKAGMWLIRISIFLVKLKH